MWKATCSWHVEGMDLYAVNYIHNGAPKTWYGIPPSECHKLEQLARKLFPDMAETCFNPMRNKCLMISPQLLRANGVQVNKLVQEERNMIIAFPHAYHSGFNHGFNMAESTNFVVQSQLQTSVEEFIIRIQNGLATQIKAKAATREEILVITRQQISANAAANEEEHLRLGYDTKKHF